MDSVFSIVFMIVALLGSFLVVGGIIYIVVKLVKTKKTEDTPIKISLGSLFKAYLYIISFITLIAAVYGGTLLIKAGSSYLFGMSFSYETYAASETSDSDPSSSYYVPECYSGKPADLNGQRVCIDETQREQDLVNGATFFVSMLLIFGIHQLALRRIEKKKEVSWLKKAYLFLSLILYSIAGVIVIPTAIYQLSNHLLYRISDPTLYGAPGAAIGVLIMVVPLWIFFLIKTTKMKESE